MAVGKLSLPSQGDLKGALGNVRSLAKGNIGIPIMLMVLLGMMTLPVPPFLLDIFFTFNIALAIVVLMVSIYAGKPLDFAIFPSVLLVATLLRLALNVASTRVVLLEGHEGGAAAGKVIEAFGEVLVGGNYAVGLVVFLILMIINFVVVTKGAGRVSEVSARFTLDAMPGKQMAIDADLNGGLIDAEQAKARRSEVANEADFYGSMDGASKFVKGDAIAGMLILLINIIGGLAIGMAQHDLDFSRATEVYALLTIGDGLVAQIPSLLLSTATAIIVTRNNSEEDVGGQVISQMFSSSRALAIASGILILMGLIPSMPHLAFLGLGVLAAVWAYWIHKRNNEPEIVDEGISGSARQAAQRAAGGGGAAPQSGSSNQALSGGSAQPALPDDTKDVDWDDVEEVDIIGLEVGYRLIPLVDKSQGGQLLGRIKGIRRKLSQDLGFLIPSVHIRDNLDLAPNAYRVLLMGVAVAEAEIEPDRDMAINPGQVFGNVEGIETIDPAFGLEAVWIESGKKDQAQTLGYTVVDASTVVATHLNQILQSHSAELIGHEEVQKMLDRLASVSPKLAEELVPNTLNLSQLLTILQNLLQEGVPVRDMRSIAEALANTQVDSQDTAALTVEVRRVLKRLIVHSIYGNAQDLSVITLDPSLEQLLLKTYQQNRQQTGQSDQMILEPSMAEKLQQSMVEAARNQEMAGNPAVLLVNATLRPVLSNFARNVTDSLHVISYQEIPDNKQITIAATIGA
ncbi:flagellar biosynthesis protein FlhA [Bermanella marisrubri]|uniref:Flagellar biosynthesis protein FlhA n=1 Tax=Bermanella marisrubri TaxID=207949 RepID=Q1N2U8_9GAMM|nr:flagellar biosynthesis protein FlhA [Bermanella marisrubri]EAT12571.1 Flagellar biosynthesis pathway, component FlhA [Oceanobacter sp. RED65] [Bermanella marisrubri]QIZ84872.1 flagellar biosynthesis protein FlhA [Bermanella marisrubri]